MKGRPVLLALLPGIFAVQTAAARPSVVLSTSWTRTTMGPTLEMDEQVELHLHRVEAMAGWDAPPLFMSFGLTFGGEETFHHDDWIYTTKYRVQATFLDVIGGCRIRLVRHIAVHAGMGVTAVVDGHVRARRDDRYRSEEDLGRVGSVVALGLTASDPKGPTVVFDVRVRSLGELHRFGDYFQGSEFGGPEYSLGVGFNFDSSAR